MTKVKPEIIKKIKLPKPPPKVAAQRVQMPKSSNRPLCPIHQDVVMLFSSIHGCFICPMLSCTETVEPVKSTESATDQRGQGSLIVGEGDINLMTTNNGRKRLLVAKDNNVVLDITDISTAERTVTPTEGETWTLTITFTEGQQIHL